MATYKLTMDVGSGPWEQGFYFYTQCGEIPWSLGEVYTDINALAEFINFAISETYGGGTYTYSINGTIVTWTWTEEVISAECGPIVAVNSGDFITKWAAVISITPELCPTCQDVTIDNCGSIIFQAAIPNGTYEVQIEDHQSGITYMQDIVFTGSQGTWDQTNTAGVFTPFSVYTVTILDASGDPVSWVDGTVEYNCMRMSFNSFNNTTPEPSGDGYRLEVTFLAEYFPYDSVNLYYQTCTENLILNGNTILQVGNSLVSVLNGLGGTASYVINNLTLTVTWLNPPTACGNPVSLNFFGNYSTEANSQWIPL